MATGKSGYFDIAGGSGFSIRVNWSETYDTATNKSIVSVDKLTIKSTTNTGIWYLNGEVSVNGAVVGTLSSGNPVTHSASIWNLDQWIELTLHDTSKAFPWASGGITHESDGSKSVAIAVDIQLFRDYNTVQPKISGSSTVALTTIPRASEITSASDVTLGKACGVKWTPKATTFYYKLVFKLGDQTQTVSGIAPKSTSAYTYSGFTIPLAWATEITAAKTGKATVTLTTHTASSCTSANQVGDGDSATFTVTVPESDATRPTVSMVLTPVSALAASFSGLYIQGKTRVKAQLSATGKYDATIKSYSMKAEGAAYDSGDDYTSDYLANAGEITVTGYATDSRGFTGSTSKNITVLAYIKPKILTVGGEVIAARCDADGNLSDSGTYLKIRAKRSYSLLTSGGVQYNHCAIQYRYKLANAANYSGWVTVLEGSSLASDEVETEPLLGGVLSAQSAYVVEVRAVDDIGESGDTTINIPTDKVYMHRTRNAMGLGKYAEKENCLDMGWDIELNGNDVLKNGSAAYAPAGYGLGEFPTKTNLDTVTKPGIYKGTVSIAGLGGNITVWCRADMSSENYGTETIFSELHGGVSLVRTKDNGTWGEWGWINPPMIPGVEYPTAEYWNGKRRCTKLIDFGALPNNASKNVSTGVDARNIIRSSNVILGGTYMIESPYLTSAGTLIVKHMFTGTQLQINTTTDYSDRTAYFQIWYIKD